MLWFESMVSVFVEREREFVLFLCCCCLFQTFNDSIYQEEVDADTSYSSVYAFGKTNGYLSAFSQEYAVFIIFLKVVSLLKSLFHFSLYHSHQTLRLLISFFWSPGVVHLLYFSFIKPLGQFQSKKADTFIWEGKSKLKKIKDWFISK